MEKIFARTRELDLLNKLWISGRAEFLAVYGRRRVGKTFLIREFFKNKGLYFGLTGIKKAKTSKQLKNFSEEFSRVFNEDVNPKSWQEAFVFLRKSLEKETSERIILFFDELPWLASPKSEFLQDLDHLWNRYLSDDPRILLIVCGSAASWMIRKVLQDKGGLHGRLTAQIRLMPFSLKETEEFLESRGVVLQRKDIVDLYMAIGGIPKYLSYVERGYSAPQIINRICFTGPLADEFKELYSSLFSTHHRHVAVVEALAAHPGGLTKESISQKTKISTGGGLNLILEELEQSGFIIHLQEFKKIKKESRFKLIDEFSLFHLKWNPKVKASSLSFSDEQFWLRTWNSAAAKTWAGYAFEVVCLKHLSQIKKALGISGVATTASEWTYKPAKGSKEKGVQIDLLIDRCDNCINLCEIKFYNEKLIVDKALDEELREKKSLFTYQTKTTKTLFITLISPYGIKLNTGYFGTADVSLTLEDLFS